MIYLFYPFLHQSFNQSILINRSSKTDLNNFNLLQQQQQLSTTLQQQQLSTTLQQQQLTSSLQQQQQINSLQQQQLNTLQQQQLNSTLQQQLNPALLQQQQHFQQIPNYNQPFPNSGSIIHSSIVFFEKNCNLI